MNASRPARPAAPAVTSEQLDALRRFKADNRRAWKQDLAHAWESGNYGALRGSNDESLLQQVRNNVGMCGVNKLVRAGHLGGAS